VSVAPVEGLEVGKPVLMPPHSFRVEGLEEQFFVYDDKMSVAVPAVLTKNVGDQTLHVEVLVPSVQFGPVPATERSQTGPADKGREAWGKANRSANCSDGNSNSCREQG